MKSLKLFLAILTLTSLGTAIAEQSSDLRKALSIKLGYDPRYFVRHTYDGGNRSKTVDVVEAFKALRSDRSGHSLHLLIDYYQRIRGYNLDVPSEVGDVAVPILVSEVRRTQDPSALWMLTYHGSAVDQVFSEILEHLDSGVKGRVIVSLSALGRSKSPEALGIVNSYLSHPDEDVRLCALESGLHLGDQELTGPRKRILLNALTNDNATQALHLLKAFGKDAAPIVPDLQKMLKTGAIRAEVRDAVGRFISN